MRLRCDDQDDDMHRLIVNRVEIDALVGDPNDASNGRSPLDATVGDRDPIANTGRHLLLPAHDGLDQFIQPNVPGLHAPCT